ncbi:MAG: phosphoribosyltransferase family protein [Candidatus Saccharimonadales bacterium]
MGVVATQEQIGQVVDGMAQKIIAAEYPNPVYLALLNGAVPFAVTLMCAIQARSSDEDAPTLYYMHVSTYGSGQEARTPRIQSDTLGALSLRDRTVIVLDDVHDTGTTLGAVQKYLLARDVKDGLTEDDIKFAVLAQKDVPRSNDIEADHVGIYLGSEWLYGAGLNGMPGVANPEAGRWTRQISIAD